jgi:ABC-2 type transport system permease protein
MRRFKRNVYIYGRLISQQLKAILEYQSDFWITLAAGAFSQTLGFVFLWVLFRNVPEMNGWQLWEIVMLYAMIYFTEGVGSAFFDGIWLIVRYVNRGEFDRMLLRPVPVLTQVLGSNVGMNGYGNLIMGTVLIIQSLRHVNILWSPAKIGFAVLLLVCAVVVRASINIVANSTSFWIKAESNSVGFMAHTVGDLAKYPLNVFPAAVKALVCVAVPYAFVSYFPVSYVLGKDGWVWGMCTPLIALICMAVASAVFYRGLRTYESTGN